MGRLDTSELGDRILFTRSKATGLELSYIAEAMAAGKLSGGGTFTMRCERWLEAATGSRRALLTHSGTGALEMAALLAGIGPGDEVIMPSYTFTSTANAFALRGAVPVFVDIRPDTLNLDERAVAAAIGPRTKAIVPVHYAGFGCAMDPINAVAAAHGLVVIEDAAQALMAHTPDGRPLGGVGTLGCLSFHDTKNLSAGEGGALLINDPALVERAEILREKGTNRSRFLRGEVDKYTWCDIGSSFLPSELTAAFLLAQLEQASEITQRRRALFDAYARALAPLAAEGRLVLPPYCGDQANGHLFWMLARDAADRDALIAALAATGIQATFHYVPLHSAPAGQRFGRAVGTMSVTDDVASRLVRLPLHLALSDEAQSRVIEAVWAYARGVGVVTGVTGDAPGTIRVENTPPPVRLTS